MNEVPIWYRGKRVSPSDLDDLDDLHDLLDSDSDYPYWNGEGWSSDSYSSGTRLWKPSSVITGRGQDLLELDDLVQEDLKATTLVVGADKRVYEQRFGLIECLSPVKLDKNEENVYVDKVDWDSFPPMSELAWLFDVFFSKYDREVLCLVGLKRDLSGWLYHTPEQTGSSGKVEWEADDEEMGKFHELARWIGTVHVHPGSSCTPSQTDINDWAEVDKSGLHTIFGRDGSYTINGAIAGKTFRLLEGSIGGLLREEVEYTTSRGRNLEDILKVQKPPVFKSTKTVKIGSGMPRHSWSTETAGGADIIERAMDRIKAVKVEPADMEDLRIVYHNNNWYVMNKSQYSLLAVWCNDLCPTPTCKTLRINLFPKGTT